ncbi:conserved hypothetical protein, partial [Ricinus communis]
MGPRLRGDDGACSANDRRQLFGHLPPQQMDVPAVDEPVMRLHGERQLQAVRPGAETAPRERRDVRRGDGRHRMLDRREIEPRHA